MSESDPGGPQPIDYANPRHFPKARRRVWMWVAAAAVLGLAWLLMTIMTEPLILVRYAWTDAQNNLRHIGQGITLYEIDFHGQFPDSFKDLILDGDADAHVFVSPIGNDTPANGATTQAIADQLLAGGHCSYVYVGRGFTKDTATASTIIAYEEVKSSPPPYAIVLYGDGHVDVVWDAVKAADVIRRASGQRAPATMPSTAGT